MREQNEKRNVTKINPVKTPMAEQNASERKSNFSEVAIGYSKEEALVEASRCLSCPAEPCRKGCPVGVPIKDFIKFIQEEKFLEAASKIKETNNLPAICGRVCPQENQCQKPCVVGKKGEPVSIGALERFASDWERNYGKDEVKPAKSKINKKVAIIGAGPAGLTCGADLAKLGYEVTIFEALHMAGGVLSYGIPKFRLPQEIVDYEVDFVKKLGADLKVNSVIGKLYTVDELLDNGFNAAFIGTGAGLPQFLNIPGENLNGVYSANEFLTRINLMKAYKFPEYDTPILTGKKVVVIGGGNTALDSARTALRLGAEASIVYRRSEEEMPGRLEEVHHAKEEGVKFEFLTAPLEILGDDDGWVTGIKSKRMKLGEPDESGRRRPEPIEGSEFIVEADEAIMAIGTSVNPLVPNNTKNLELNKRGYIVADSETGATNRPGIFAGGDIVTGAATVITAMGAGKRAAVSIDEYLKSKN